MDRILIAFLLVLNTCGFAAVSAPVNTARPAIDNNAPGDVGITLTATPGAYTNFPTSYVRQWKRDGVDIAGATGLTYVTAEADRGHKLSFYETASNVAGRSPPIRAKTGLPRLLLIDGDSITANPNWPEMLELGPTWNVVNYAVSAQRIDHMAEDAAIEIDPSVDVGWSVLLGWEYINQAAVSSGQEIYDKAVAYNAARAAAGFIVLTATDFHIKESCQFAGDLMRKNFPDSIELDRDDLRADAHIFGATPANGGIGDDIHLTAVGEKIVATVVQAKLNALGLGGDCGGIPVPNAQNLIHLRSFTNPGYLYDPFNPLPCPATALYLHVTDGPHGWNKGSFRILGAIQSFRTPEGMQTLYAVEGQTAGGLSNGTYFLSNSP